MTTPELWRLVTAELIRSEAARFGYTLARGNFDHRAERRCCVVGALGLAGRYERGEPGDIDEIACAAYGLSAEDAYALSTGFEFAGADDAVPLHTPARRHLHAVGREVAASLPIDR